MWTSSHLNLREAPHPKTCHQSTEVLYLNHSGVIGAAIYMLFLKENVLNSTYSGPLMVEIVDSNSGDSDV